MPIKRTETEAVNMRLPKNMIEAIDVAIEIGQGSSRSDIIKTAIANYLKELTVTSEMKKRKLS
jgi:metal-responsive CopG/Arc/MetJ family transcriptional regulator